MGSTEDDVLDEETVVETAIQQYLDSVEAGNSRKNFQSALARWDTWLEDEHGVTSLNELEVLDRRRSARHLKQHARDSELKAGTATTFSRFSLVGLSLSPTLILRSALEEVGYVVELSRRQLV